jgi:hypothetical protein
MMKNLLFHTEKALRELTRPDGRQKKKKKKHRGGTFRTVRPWGPTKGACMAGRTYPRTGVPARPPAGGGRY